MRSCRRLLLTLAFAVAAPAAAFAQVVNDGPAAGVDVDVQPSSMPISATWSGMDPSAVEYQWAIGTQAFLADVQPFTTVVPNLATAAVNPAIFPVEGTTYFVTVQAIGPIGKPIDVISSDGVTVVKLNDGPFTFSDRDFQTSADPIEATWDFLDGRLTNYDWAIGTTPGAEDIQPFTNVGNVTTASNLTFVPVEATLYYVTVRGYIGTTLTTTLISDGVTIVRPPGAVPVSGEVPLTVSFTQQLPGVVLYHWDFDEPAGVGGKTTHVSTESGDATFTYLVPGQYDAALTMVHQGGGTWFDVVTIDVLPSPLSPTTGLSADVTSGEAPLTVTFTATPSTFDGTVSAYLWDFDGDGTPDASSPDVPVITHTYTRVGFFSAAVTVVDGNGGQAVQSVLIDVQTPTTGPIVPTISMFTSTPQDSILGEIVTFDVVADPGGGMGTILSYTWDFDGDGEVDRVTTTPMTTWQYEEPGFQSARVIVTDDENLSARSFLSHDVDLAPLVPRCWLVQPLNGLTVWGDFVSLGAFCIPPGQVASVEFKYRPSDGMAFPPHTDASWVTIDTATPPPVELFGVHWDVTGLTQGAKYDLIAVATFSGGAVVSSAGIQEVTVTVDSVNPDEEEFHGSPFTTLLVTTFSPTLTVTKGATRDITFKLIAGTSPSLEQMRMERRSENPHPVEATLQGLRFLPGHFRNLSLKGGGVPAKPTRVTMYRDPGSSTVLADGTDLTKAKFRLYCFNEKQFRWEPLLGQTSNPSKLLMKGSLVSTGDVGIAVVSSRSTVSSSSDDCGLLGPEALLPILLLFVRRRRRRA